MIIFDIGGVLMKGHISDLYNHLVKKLDVHPQSFFEAKGKYIDDAIIGKITADELKERIATTLKIDPSLLKEKWREAFLETLTVDEGVLEIIRRLKREHTVVALTNVIEFDTETCRLRGDYECFDRVFTSWELKAAKPGMEIYMQVVRELGVDPKECIFIDDAAENLIPAAAIGMRTIHYRDASTLKNDLHRMGAL